MITFEVKDMSCGHCIAAITQAVQAVDAGATVQADLDHRRVSVSGTAVGSDVLRAAIVEAGFTPEPA